MANLERSSDLFEVNKLQDEIKAGWLVADYQPPSVTLSYEPTFKAWYLVVDDSSPIIELADETGAIFIVEKSKCRRNNNIYICQQVKAIHDFPITDRQYFVWESLIPLINDDYNIA